MANIKSINGNPIVVGSSGIEDGAVIESKLHSNSVASVHIKDGAVSTSKLADGAVTTAKLANDSVSVAKLSDDVNTSCDNSRIVETARSLLPNHVTPKADNGILIADSDGNVLLSTGDIAKSTRMDVSAYKGLAIADVDGNVVFDANEGWPNTLAGKTFSIIGDSISTFNGWIPSGYASYYPRSDVTDVHHTWWKILEDTTGMKLIKTASWSGSRISGDSTTTDGSCGCSDARIAAAGGDAQPDIIILFMGTNDLGSNINVGHADYMTKPSEGQQTTLSDAYLLALYKLHETYPNAHVFCATLLPRRAGETDVRPYKNGNNDGTNEYNVEIKRLAAAMNCGIIDFAACGFNIQGMDGYFYDHRLHPNNSGMKVMARAARKAIEVQYNM